MSKRKGKAKQPKVPVQKEPKTVKELEPVLQQTLQQRQAKLAVIENNVNQVAQAVRELVGVDNQCLQILAKQLEISQKKADK